jgi:DNA-binding transcriptional LysR family regulator
MVLQGLGVGLLATLVAGPLVDQELLLPVLPTLVDVQPVPLYANTASARQRLPKTKTCIKTSVQCINWEGTPTPAALAAWMDFPRLSWKH